MKTKLNNGFKKVRKWIKKHKVLTVFLILAAVVIGIYFRLQRAGQEMAGQEYISVVLKAASRPGLYDNMTEIIQKIGK